MAGSVDTPVLFVTPGKGEDCVTAFRAFLVEHGGEPTRIAEVVCDMSGAFIAAVGETFENAAVTVDCWDFLPADKEFFRGAALNLPAWLPRQPTRRAREEGRFRSLKRHRLTLADDRRLHEGTPIHCTRDASRDIKPGCQDNHPAAIVPRPPPSDPRPTGRGARLLPRLRRRSRRWLSGTVGLPIGAVDRNGGLMLCRRWRTCWTSFRSGGTTCPPAWKAARRRKRSMSCWSCAVMSKIFRRSSCQKASAGTDGASALRWLPPASGGRSVRTWAPVRITGLRSQS